MKQKLGKKCLGLKGVGLYRDGKKNKLDFRSDNRETGQKEGVLENVSRSWSRDPACELQVSC